MDSKISPSSKIETSPPPQNSSLDSGLLRKRSNARSSTTANLKNRISNTNEPTITLPSLNLKGRKKRGRNVAPEAEIGSHSRSSTRPSNSRVARISEHSTASPILKYGS